MRIAFAQRFLEDLTEAPSPIRKKSRELISELFNKDAKQLISHAMPGWRLHKLHSSPFKSFSVDMNYRMLVKVDGDCLTHASQLINGDYFSIGC